MSCALGVLKNKYSFQEKGPLFYQILNKIAVHLQILVKMACVTFYEVVLSNSSFGIDAEARRPIGQVRGSTFKSVFVKKFLGYNTVSDGNNNRSSV
jgi:hypothetical protein